MPIKLANNASGTLATAISASDTGIALTTGDGAEFPTLGAGDYFYATITSSQGTQEIVRVNARSGDSLTVVRAQEGTTAAGFAAGARFELRVTAQSVFDAVGDVVASQVSFTPTGGISATDVQVALAEVDTEKVAFTRLDDNDGSSLVGFLQAGTSAVTTTVQAKLRETVSVFDFMTAVQIADVQAGTLNEDVTAVIVAACAASNYIVFPTGTYKITSTIEPGFGKALRFDDVTISSTVAGPAFLMRGNTDAVTFSGNVGIDCGGVVGSVGIRIQGNASIASATTSNTFDIVSVRNATIGIHLLSDGNRGVYYNTFRRVGVNDCTTGILLETTAGGASQRDCNANHFGMVTLQRCVDALVLDGTWGNYFDFVEAESNTGTAIKIMDAFTVGINGGWIEGNLVNIDIANTPDVYGVYIKAAIDSPLDSTDAKFIYTPSAERSIIIENSQYTTWFGRARFEERVDIGDYGIAGNDQGNAPDGRGRLRVTASQDFFRLSSGTPLFYMRGRTGMDGWYFALDDGSTQLFDLQRSRAFFSTSVTVGNMAWNQNTLRLGGYYLWVDATGDLRIKSGAPSSDTDGTVVGTQT